MQQPAALTTPLYTSACMALKGLLLQFLVLRILAACCNEHVQLQLATKTKGMQICRLCIAADIPCISPSAPPKLACNFKTEQRCPRLSALLICSPVYCRADMVSMTKAMEGMAQALSPMCQLLLPMQLNPYQLSPNRSWPALLPKYALQKSILLMHLIAYAVLRCVSEFVQNSAERLYASSSAAG